ncbi:MAG: LysE family transporter [Spirochaetes bacterium]|nr:LysE family transporter [Spirochaetota bacterium]
MDTSYLQFLLTAMLISLSGVMAPGPLLAMTVGKGSESPHAGALIAVGHAIVEFPLMTAIFFGFGYLFSLPHVRESIGLAGGLLLFFMAAGMFRSIKGSIDVGSRGQHSPLYAGMFLTAANPYFLIWWATVGASMVMQAAGFGTAGLVIFMIMHWFCDLGWSWFMSTLSFKGGRFFGKKFQKWVFAVSGVLLMVFAGKFIYEAVVRLI